MIDFPSPLRSLQEGHWFKLICGASFQHLPSIRTLALVYTLAGADCIDVAADPAIVAIAREARATAQRIAQDLITHDRLGAALALDSNPSDFYSLDRIGSPPQTPPQAPWLMVSLNDGEDPHFRKAEFTPTDCPTDCPRPCEKVCPANAIVFQRSGDNYSGIINDLCYGCGRCLPVCPVGQISTRSAVSTPAAMVESLFAAGIDALEIHTQVGRLEAFSQLWAVIQPWADRLKLLSISCPDSSTSDPHSETSSGDLIDYLSALQALISPLPCALVWQTDGRPMSGDIGDGATRACVKLGQKVLAANLPGYVQLAGGTNRHTVPKLAALGLLQNNCGESRTDRSPRSQVTHPWADRTVDITPEANHHSIAGIAYGSYARSLLLPILTQLDSQLDTSPEASTHIETQPFLLWQGVHLAHSLVSQLKSPPRLGSITTRFPSQLSPPKQPQSLSSQ